ncbi:MAG: hypothetical protein ABI910_08795 [Gemmatimonadota bacterium]
MPIDDSSSVEALRAEVERSASDAANAPPTITVADVLSELAHGTDIPPGAARTPTENSAIDEPTHADRFAENLEDRLRTSFDASTAEAEPSTSIEGSREGEEPTAERGSEPSRASGMSALDVSTLSERGASPTQSRRDWSSDDVITFGSDRPAAADAQRYASGTDEVDGLEAAAVHSSVEDSAPALDEIGTLDDPLDATTAEWMAPDVASKTSSREDADLDLPGVSGIEVVIDRDFLPVARSAAEHIDALERWDSEQEAEHRASYADAFVIDDAAHAIDDATTDIETYAHDAASPASSVADAENVAHYADEAADLSELDDSGAAAEAPETVESAVSVAQATIDDANDAKAALSATRAGQSDADASLGEDESMAVRQIEGDSPLIRADASSVSATDVHAGPLDEVSTPPVVSAATTSLVRPNVVRTSLVPSSHAPPTLAPVLLAPASSEAVGDEGTEERDDSSEVVRAPIAPGSAVAAESAAHPPTKGLRVGAVADRTDEPTLLDDELAGFRLQPGEAVAEPVPIPGMDAMLAVAGSIDDFVAEVKDSGSTSEGYILTEDRASNDGNDAQRLFAGSALARALRSVAGAVEPRGAIPPMDPLAVGERDLQALVIRAEMQAHVLSTLEMVARRVRAGELVLSVDSGASPEAVLASVLASILSPRT